MPEDGGWLVLFHTEWCGHCDKLMPIWDELAELHRQEMGAGQLRVASVDCEADSDLCLRFQINTYPTILYFPSALAGESIQYLGRRTVDGFERFTLGNEWEI